MLMSGKTCSTRMLNLSSREGQFADDADPEIFMRISHLMVLDACLFLECHPRDDRVVENGDGHRSGDLLEIVGSLVRPP
jgi:hypothetical protein